MLFLDRFVKQQSFIQLNTDDTFLLMISMYGHKNEVVIFVTVDDQQTRIVMEGVNEVLGSEQTDQPHDEECSDYCQSEQSYHSRHNSSSEDDSPEYEGETYAYNKNDPNMKVNSKFPNVVAFRSALNHYALVKVFEYLIKKSDLERVTARCTDKNCAWRIHASVLQDDITFENRKTMKEKKKRCTFITITARRPRKNHRKAFDETNKRRQ